jgi:hypothetical protein
LEWRIHEHGQAARHVALCGEIVRFGAWPAGKEKHAAGCGAAGSFVRHHVSSKVSAMKSATS